MANEYRVTRVTVLALTTLTDGTPLPAGAGAFAIAGNNANFLVAHKIAAAVAAYDLVGGDTLFSPPGVSWRGKFLIMGDASLLYSRRLPAAAGDYGLSASASSGYRSLSAEPGAVALGGADAYIYPISPVDPFRSQVVLLLHGDAFVDSSPSVKTVNHTSGVSISGIRKFGAGSFQFPGNYSSERVWLEDSPDWIIGTNQFTMEGWFRFTALKSCVFMTQWGNAWCWWYTGGQLGFRVNNAQNDHWVSWSPTLNQWHAIAVDRDANNTIRFYVDGVMVGKKLNFADNLWDTWQRLDVGSLADAGWWDYCFPGQIDELRFTNGVARYKSDAGYTLQSTPFSQAAISAASGSVAFAGGEAQFQRSTRTLKGYSYPINALWRSATLDKRNAFSASYTLAGQDASYRHLVPTYLHAAAGDFALAGPTTYLRRQWTKPAAMGRFALEGAAAIFRRSRILVADVGDWAVAGQDLRFGRRTLLRAAGDAFTLAGSSTAYRHDWMLSAAPLVLSFSATAARLMRHWVGPSSYLDLAISASDAAMRANKRLSGNATAYSWQGQATALYASRLLVAAATDYTMAGQAANPVKGHTVFGECGAFAAAGEAAKKHMVRTGRAGRFVWRGGDVELWAGWGGEAIGSVVSTSATGGVEATGSVLADIQATIVEGELNSL